jgi:hypothetical protein
MYEALDQTAPNRITQMDHMEQNQGVHRQIIT